MKYITNFFEQIYVDKLNTSSIDASSRQTLAIKRRPMLNVLLKMRHESQPVDGDVGTRWEGTKGDEVRE